MPKVHRYKKKNVRHESNRLYIMRSDVQRMIESAIFTYKETTLNQLLYGIIRNTLKPILEKAAKEAAKEFLRPIYGRAGDTVGQAATRSAANNTISGRLDRYNESHRFAQIIVGILVKTKTFKASINKLFKRNAEITTMKEGKFHDPSRNVT